MTITSTLIALAFVAIPQESNQSTLSKADKLREKIGQVALRHIGVPYVWGGNNMEKGIDLSHYIYEVYRLAGAKCPAPPMIDIEKAGRVVWVRPGSKQINRGEKMVDVPAGVGSDLSALKKGDIIVIQKFPSKPESRHGGIYLGPMTYRGRVFQHAVAHATRPVSRVQELTDRGLYTNLRYVLRFIED